MRRMLTLAILLFATPLLADTFCWKVSDGDTIWVADERGAKTKIRMNRIDAPEMNQPYGREAADRLAELVLGKYVTLETNGHDQYGRSLDVVFVDTPKGRLDVNLQLVKEGLAWQYYTDKSPSYTQAFLQAKAKKIGLWADPNAKNPYHWRKEGHPAAPDEEYNRRVVAIPKGGAPKSMTGSKTPRSVCGDPKVGQKAPETPAVAPSALPRIEYRAGGQMPVGSRTAAPVCDKWPETGYWLSTNSNKRHNKGCENYRKTRGYPCNKDDGESCGKCGG